MAGVLQAVEPTVFSSESQESMDAEEMVAISQLQTLLGHESVDADAHLGVVHLSFEGHFSIGDTTLNVSKTIKPLSYDAVMPCCTTGLQTEHRIVADWHFFEMQLIIEDELEGKDLVPRFPDMVTYFRFVVISQIELEDLLM